MDWYFGSLDFINYYFLQFLWLPYYTSILWVEVNYFKLLVRHLIVMKIVSQEYLWFYLNLYRDSILLLIDGYIFSLFQINYKRLGNEFKCMKFWILEDFLVIPFIALLGHNQCFVNFPFRCFLSSGKKK